MAAAVAAHAARQRAREVVAQQRQVRPEAAVDEVAAAAVLEAAVRDRQVADEAQEDAVDHCGARSPQCVNRLLRIVTRFEIGSCTVAAYRRARRAHDDPVQVDAARLERHDPRVLRDRRRRSGRSPRRGASPTAELLDVRAAPADDVQRRPAARADVSSPRSASARARSCRPTSAASRPPARELRRRRCTWIVRARARVARARGRRPTSFEHGEEGRLPHRPLPGETLSSACVDSTRAAPLPEIADSFFRPAVAEPRPVRAGQAGRGGAARARARARRQARVERGPVRAVPGGARGARARGAAS